jgi:hypothetical protein
MPWRAFCSNREELDHVTPFASATLLISPELRPLAAQSPVRPANANFSVMNGVEATFAVGEKREGWDVWGDEVEKFSSARRSAESISILVSGSEQAGVRP